MSSKFKWWRNNSTFYKNNGEQCCQFCHAYMTEEEYNFCDICPDCRDKNYEWEQKAENFIKTGSYYG